MNNIVSVLLERSILLLDGWSRSSIALSSCAHKFNNESATRKQQHRSKQYQQQLQHHILLSTSNMKFIQLLSTIASLAIFATAPGVSAAGLRATGDAGDKREEEASGRRSLQGMIYGLPGQVPGMPGPKGVPGGMPGMHYGMPGTVPGMPTGPNMYTPPAAYYDYGDEGNFGDNYDYDDDDYDYDNSGDYSDSGNNYSNGSRSGNCCKSTQTQGCPRDMSVVRATSACGQTTYQLCCDSAGAGSMSCNGHSIQAFTNANMVNDRCYA